MSSDRHAASNSTSAQDNNLFLDVSNEAPLCGQRKRTGIVGSIFYCLLLSGYAALSVGAPWIFRSKQHLISQWLCTSDVVLLAVTGVFQQYMVYQVKKIRLQGYYIFSQKLKHIIRLPFATIAYGTAAMLLVMVWEPHISILPIAMLLRIGVWENIVETSLLIFSHGLVSLRCNFRIIMVTEVIFAGSFMSVYIGNVHQYNSLESQPDVLKSLYSPLQPSSSLEGLSYYDGGRLSDQQMALLQYQQENLNFLSEEILRLQESLSKYERSVDGMTPQVDLAHLLAARDQELRTLSAEMNQLESELKLARSLIGEKESEIQHVQTTNNQYVEENERLRGILGEWSTRAAKLERALEVERMSNMELQKRMKRSTTQSSHHG